MMVVSSRGLAAPARGAAALQQGLEGAGGARVSLGVAHQTRSVHERQTDALAVVCELLAIEIGAEVALVDRDARGPSQGVDPVAQVLDDEIAHRSRPIVELEG